MHYLTCICGVNGDIYMWDDIAECQWQWHHRTAAVGPPRSCVRSPYSQFALQHRPDAVSAAWRLEWTKDGIAEGRKGGVATLWPTDLTDTHLSMVKHHEREVAGGPQLQMASPPLTPERLQPLRIAKGPSMLERYFVFEMKAEGSPSLNRLSANRSIAAMKTPLYAAFGH